MFLCCTRNPKRTATLPLKIGHHTQEEMNIVFQASIFRGKPLVLGSVSSVLFGGL